MAHPINPWSPGSSPGSSCRRDETFSMYFSTSVSLSELSFHHLSLFLMCAIGPTSQYVITSSVLDRCIAFNLTFRSQFSFPIHSSNDTVLQLRLCSCWQCICYKNEQNGEREALFGFAVNKLAAVRNFLVRKLKLCHYCCGPKIAECLFCLRIIWSYYARVLNDVSDK
jgi:hypothetical protein